MRCADAQKQSSAYLDSDLSPERSAALRGHLRTCEGCHALFEREREIIEAAQQLPALDPPDSIWLAIQDRIAGEEVKDSQEWPMLRWLRFHWRPLAGGGVVAAMAVVLIMARSESSQSEQAVGPAPALAEVTLAEVMVASYEEARDEELAEADRHYTQTIAELRAMLEEDRPSWSDGQVTAVDAQLAAYRKDAIGTRLAIESGNIAVESRDLVYASYRSEIGFLQSALAGDLPEELK